MPDITMCSGEGCNDKDRCYRHIATPTPHRQSYFVTPPIKDNECNDKIMTYDYLKGETNEHMES